MELDQRSNRYVLGVLLAFLALNAFAGGIYALGGAEGVPREWLGSSPFETYFIPGLILFVVVGGSAAVAATALLLGRRAGVSLAKLAGWLLLVWMIGQLVIVGFVSWMQPATVVFAVLILTLAYARVRDQSVSVARNATRSARS